MFTRTLKTAALAAIVIVATAGASLAAQYAYVDHNAKVKKHHQNASMTVNQVWTGQKVKIIGGWGNWYKIQVPGPDGWVKASTLSFGPNWNNNPWPANYPYGNGGSFCVNGQNASFCISGGY